jgi:two-component system CheB/CheR fusion protein
MLGPKATQDFSLALHELATNAGKYGSLSNGTGHVAISWMNNKNGKTNSLRFCWKERGGPAVGEPTRHGFGTALLKATFPDINLHYESEGLRCEMDLPLNEKAIS